MKTIKSFLREVKAVPTADVIEMLRCGYYEDDVKHYEFEYNYKDDSDELTLDTEIIDVEESDSWLVEMQKSRLI